MDEICGAYMPADMAITCRLKKGSHPEHLGGYAPSVFLWPNEDWIPQSTGDPAEVAKRIAAKMTSQKNIPEVSPYLNHHSVPQKA